MKKVLTIAGSDSSGGAGVQADLKTFTVFGVYGLSAVTAVTAQNTEGVRSVHELPPDFVAAQVESVVDDIGVDAVKTGMLASPAVVEAVARSVEKYGMPHLVVDTVMASGEGEPLLSEDAVDLFKKRLLPLAEVVTPNVPEAEILAGTTITSVEDMKKAAERIAEAGCKWVVVKGGHLAEWAKRTAAESASLVTSLDAERLASEAVDVVWNGTKCTTLQAPFLEGSETHGTGCAFSAAITACLAKGMEPLAAIERAKKYVGAVIESGLSLGKGRNVPAHFKGMTSDWS